jgi:hypothetical protein
MHAFISFQGRNHSAIITGLDNALWIPFACTDIGPMIAAVISKGKLPNDFANPMTMFVI